MSTLIFLKFEMINDICIIYVDIVGSGVQHTPLTNPLIFIDS